MYEEKNIVISGATVIFAGQPMGWTKDPLTIGIEDDKLKIDDVQQKIGVVDIRRTKFSLIIKLNLYEFTLENIQKSFGLNANIVYGSSSKTLSIDASGDYPEGELIIYCKGPDGVLRTIKYYKAKLIDRGDTSLDAYGATVIPITFQVLVHPDYDTALGIIEEEYVPSNVVNS
ncbi:MAG TPA: hypothetical protein ENI52_04010 [Thermoplasmata archaeon]|nr:hypothetical protein [Thermoplasmata archaeon]